MLQLCILFQIYEFTFSRSPSFYSLKGGEYMCKINLLEQIKYAKSVKGQALFELVENFHP